MSSKTNFDEMGKGELRAACKAAGISYGKLTVQSMRAALVARAAVNADELSIAKQEDAPTDLAGQGIRSLHNLIDKANTAPVNLTPVAPKAPKTTKPEREARNGVKRPRNGGLCAAVWAALDKLHASGTAPTSEQVRDLATAKGWNANNALCELSAWRKFMGLSKPRVMSKRKTVAKAAGPAVLTEAAAAS